MAWARCPTHGPIQDARPVYQAGVVVRLVCACNMECETYEPEGFVEHDELKELAQADRQPREDAPELDAPTISEEPEALGGGWYLHADGSKTHGL